MPVEHVVADIDNEGLPFKVTLVVANRTASSAPLLEALVSKAEGERPAPVHRRDPAGGRRGPARAAARGRLNQVVERLRGDGLSPPA